MRSYDSWLEPREAAECPQCGGQGVEDQYERTFECECGYSYAFDWDQLAEARAEARMDDDDGRDVW